MSSRQNPNPPLLVCGEIRGAEGKQKPQPRAAVPRKLPYRQAGRAGDVALALGTNVNVACDVLLDVLLDLPLDLPAVRRAPASAGARA
jgi:hypothetical protein